MSRRRARRVCEGCGTRPARQRVGARFCSPCVAKLPKKTCAECAEPFAPDMMNGPRCRPCASKKAHAKRIEQTFTLTPVQYAELLAYQGGACFICRRKPVTKRLAVDHDHGCCPGPTSCGKCVRGLLCRSCNRDVLGNLKDSIAALYRAIEYLERPPARRLFDGDTAVCNDGSTTQNE